MIEGILQYMRKTPVRVMILLAGFLNAALYIFIFLRIRPTEQPIPLHFNIYYGIDYIGHWYMIYAIPGAGTLVILLNTYIAYIMDKKDEYFGYLALTAMLVSQVLLIITGVLIVLLNI